MILRKSLFSLVLGLSAVLGVTVPSQAAGASVETHQQDWSFSGIFGTYDKNQLRRGFQVFQEVCASCHGLDYIAFRNLGEPGGTEYSDDQIRGLAEQYKIIDKNAADGIRDGLSSDKWPRPFESDQIARDSNGGALPPDLSLIAKARGIQQEFPFWVFNYFTAYQEAGADYVYNLLTRYEDAPTDVTLAAGQHYNAYFPGHILAMGSPLSDGVVSYGGTTPETVEQYSHDVSAFLQWTADPHMISRKSLGMRVILFLLLFAGLMYAVKRKIWKDQH